MPKGKKHIARKVGRPRKYMPKQATHENSDSAATSFKISNSQSPSDSIRNGAEIESDEAYAQDFSGEMAKLLEPFSTDVNKTVQAKRKKLEQFTQESTRTTMEKVRTTMEKVLETDKNQSLERRKLVDDFQSHFLGLLQQEEDELKKIKYVGDKLQKLLVQQQKQQQQRVKALKNLSEEFCKGMNELEKSHVQQYSAVHNVLRKEMALLQKKILMETE